MRTRLNRRDLLRLAPPSLVLPAGLTAGRVRAAGGPPAAKQIVFVPRAIPASLDPIATPSPAVRAPAAAVFESLYGTDAALNPMPQMVERSHVENDGRVWVFQLRAGLLFHDGTGLTARDCAASLRRWMRRDRTGQALGARMDRIEATADDTLTLYLARPLHQVPLMLTKSEASPPVIMPKRLADSSIDRPVAEIVGSGPFRLADPAWRPGQDLDLVRFDRYSPRPEPSSFTGGRRVVLLDRVLFRMPDDPLRALRDGTADWLEDLSPELAPGEADDPAIRTGRLDEIGFYAMLRLNAWQGPAANPRVRQAILAGVDPAAVMEAAFGADSGRFRSPVGLFPPDSEFVTTAGMDRIGAIQSPKTIKARLADAGYKGEPIIVVDPVDDAVHSRLTTAVSDELRLIGLTVQPRKLDREAFAAWRAAARHPGSGGEWTALCDSVPSGDHYDPLAISAGSAPTAGDGGGVLWPGWPDDPAAARLRDAWIDAPELSLKRDIAAQLQTQVFTTAAFVPLGQWFPTAAWRADVTGQQKGSFPVFWDVART